MKTLDEELLEIQRQAVDLMARVSELNAESPAGKRDPVLDQLRRSAASVAANIAQARKVLEK